MKTAPFNTFWKLISNYPIEVPIIQRDYAQGRPSTEIQEIRSNFLETLHKAISTDRHIDFDFIYGSIENRAGRTKFIPLDGQQRLTTLFLLHWYLAAREGKIADCKEILSGFTYETRASSREFCKALVNKCVVLPSTGYARGGSESGSISAAIKDASWFFLSWQDDPTISSMLVKLDAIHQKFSNSEGFFEKLTREEDPPVTFQFLELKDYGLTDSLYIKMNARGKALTDFENFKAKFEQFLEREFPCKSKDFAQKIDGIWTDLFWNYRDKHHSIDQQFMNFFRALVVGHYALKMETGDVEENLKFLALSKGNISFSKYTELGCFTEGVVEGIEGALDGLVNGVEKIKTYLPDTSYIDERALFEKALKYDFTYTERIQFFALTKFLVVHKGQVDGSQLNDWMRIIRNLSENTVYNEVADYARSIIAINKLLEYSHDILDYVSNHTFSGFLDLQIQEERIKALLIRKSSEWKELILKFENYGYFKGQIEFLLKFSGISDYFRINNQVNWSADEDKAFLESFTTYAWKACTVFSEKGLKSFKEYAWERALLCKGNYLLTEGRNHSFLIDSDRDISWKRLLRDDNKDNAGRSRRKYVQELFDSINIQSIQEDLEAVIESSSIQDWRKYFIKYPGIIQACGTKRYIRLQDEQNILLLASSTTSGYHNEYYSYALKQRLLAEGHQVEYMPERSRDYEKYISQINGRYIHLSYVHQNNGWRYKVKLDETDIFFFNTEEEVVDFLKSSGFLTVAAPVA